MGLPIYAEQGRNGGYKVLTNRVIPPILFTEEEAVSIFFAFQSLSYYRDLPFNTEINSVTHKLYSSLQNEAKAKVDKIRSYIAFWNPKRTIETPLLNEVLTAAIENKNLHFQYESKSGIKTNMFILSVYMLMMGYGTYRPMTMTGKRYYCIASIVFFLYYQRKKMRIHS